HPVRDLGPCRGPRLVGSDPRHVQRPHHRRIRSRRGKRRCDRRRLGGRPSGRNNSTAIPETSVMTVAIKQATPGSSASEAPILLLLKLRTFIALFAVVIFFSFAAHNFLNLENVVIMSRHVALNAFLAIGMT